MRSLELHAKVDLNSSVSINMSVRNLASHGRGLEAPLYYLFTCILTGLPGGGLPSHQGSSPCELRGHGPFLCISEPQFLT